MDPVYLTGCRHFLSVKGETEIATQNIGNY